MGAGGLIVGAAVGIGLIALLASTSKAEAAQTYTCPYGDGLTFPTLLALQQHVAEAHPGQRIPIMIRW